MLLKLRLLGILIDTSGKLIKYLNINIKVAFDWGKIKVFYNNLKYLLQLF